MSYGQRVLDEIDRLHLGTIIPPRMRAELPSMDAKAIRRRLALPFPFSQSAELAEPEELVHLALAARIKAARVLLIIVLIETAFLPFLFFL